MSRCFQTACSCFALDRSLLDNVLLSVCRYTQPTRVQSEAIPLALAGSDLLVNASTGSGKTAAFMLPVLERLQYRSRRVPLSRVLVLLPTRELAVQCQAMTLKLAQYTDVRVALVVGGLSMSVQEVELRSRPEIVIATPGRLIDHLRNSATVHLEDIEVLILDEADRLLEEGFEEEMHAIVRILPKTRQTALFSATQTKRVEDLARLAVQGTPEVVGVDEDDAVATVSTLEQGFVVCPSDVRFRLLYTFLKRNLKKKVMVFFSSCNSVRYHAELLNYIDVPVLDIHGKQKQAKRTTTFFDFCKAQSGILLCTDVAARGLDIPFVDWIIQVRRW